MRGLEHDLGDALVLLELAVRRFLGPEVGDRGGHHDDVGRRRPGQHRVLHLGRGLDRHDLDARRRGPADGGDEGDVGAPAGRDLGDGVALLARRAVGDDAHRVDRLAGAARGDQHPDPGEVVRAPATRVGRGGDDVGRVGEPALADVAAGEAARLGVDHVHAPAPQRGEVLLHRGVLPHLGVHRRRHEDRRPGGEQRGGEQVVGDAGGVLAEQRGGGRRDDHEVGAAGRGGCAGSGRAGPGSNSERLRARAPTPAPRT